MLLHGCCFSLFIYLCSLAVHFTVHFQQKHINGSCTGLAGLSLEMLRMWVIHAHGEFKLG